MDEWIDFLKNIREKHGLNIRLKLMLISAFMKSDFDAQDVINNLKSIRILTVEDEELNNRLNFFEELASELDLSGYEELMVVKESDKDLKFLVKEKGKRIDELLMIGGGPGQNVLISIKGDLDLQNISSISKTMGIEELQNSVKY